MKKLHIILYAAFLLCHSFCFAQNTDSLWSIYRNTSESDTTRLKALYDIANSNLVTNPYTAIIFAQQELQFAEKTNQIKYKGKALNLIGALYKNKGIYPTALDYFLKALNIFEEIRDKKGMGNCYANIGDVYYNQTEYTKALLFYKKALKARQDAGGKPPIASSYADLGNLYSSQSDYESALKYHFIALKIREEIGDKQGIAYCYNNIGVVYKNQANYTKALEYYFKCLNTIKEVDDKKGITYCYNNIGNIYLDLSNYKLALLYCDSSLQIAKRIGDINAERTTYQNLAQIFFKTDRYKEAYEYETKFKALTDSIFNIENSRQLGDLKTSFEVEKKEAELNAKMEKQQAIGFEQEKREQIIIYAVSGILLVSVIFSFILYKRFKYINKQKQTIEYLFKEVHHRVKNNMQVITSLLNLQRGYIDDKRIQDIFQDCQNRIAAMASIHTKLYGQNALSEISFTEYIKNLITQLIDTYQIKYQVKYNLDIEEVKFDIDTLIPIGLLTNEIISNTLKYAFINDEKNNIITFKLKRNEGDVYELIIGDNGKGYKVDLEAEHTTFGLDLIKILTNQLKGKISQLPVEGTTYKVVFSVH